MGRNYYSLVAGLREYAVDSDKKGFDAGVIKDEIRSELSKADREYLKLFYNFYDIENIINISGGKTRFNSLGNFSREELEHEIKSPSKLPGYIADVVMAYADPENLDYEDVDHSVPMERSLFEAFYRKCRSSKCRFIRDWYEFDSNLRNVLAAYAARHAGLPVADQLIGEGYVTDTLARSSAADFGLKGELEYIDDVVDALGDEVNMLEKERKIDLIRWEMSDTLTTFDYFDINAILAYLVKINLIHRWFTLDESYGREMFRKLMASLASKDLLDSVTAQNEK